MKVLFVVNALQKSFDTFISAPFTNSPWVDAIIETLTSSDDIDCGLALPVLSNKIERHRVRTISIYGLPCSPAKPRTIFSRRYYHSNSEQELLVNLKKCIHEFNPDIVYVFGTENTMGLISRMIDIPVVIHFQGSVNTVAQKWYTAIPLAEQKASLTMRKIFYKAGVYNEYFTFNTRGEREVEIMKGCNYFLGRTEFDKRLINFFSPNSAYFHCDEFIRKEFFEMTWSCSSFTNIRCISILKGVTYKGIDLLFDTAKVLKQNGRNNFKFVICGVNENEEIAKMLINRYGKSGILDSITFLGRLNTGELIREMLDSNIYIHPSYMENSSNSICEAMALGMPVVATNVGGTASLISDGFDGMLVQEGDAISLAATLSILSKNLRITRNIGLQARERAVKRHDPVTLKNRVIEIFNEILQ